MKIIPKGYGMYLVESSKKDKFYFVNLSELYCDCPSTKMQCKHIQAVLTAIMNETIPGQRSGNIFGTTTEEAERGMRI